MAGRYSRCKQVREMKVTLTRDLSKLAAAVLRHELEDEHTYEFVEATLEAPMSEGKIGALLLSPSR